MAVPSIFVTGFGPFAGCDNNPTAALIDLLNEHIERVGPDPAYRVLGTKVLECAARPVRQWLDELYDGLAAAAATEPSLRRPVVVLHMGVDVTLAGPVFKLEQQAVNEASFRVPDRAGWQPSRQLIDDHPGLTLASRLRTDLDVAALAARLEARAHDARPSCDAGRYVCNWTLYLSLLRSQQLRQRGTAATHALFLHVPPAAAAPLGAQLALLLDLLAALAGQLAAGGGPVAEADGPAAERAPAEVRAA